MRSLSQADLSGMSPTIENALAAAVMTKDAACGKLIVELEQAQAELQAVRELRVSTLEAKERAAKKARARRPAARKRRTA